MHHHLQCQFSHCVAAVHLQPAGYLLGKAGVPKHAIITALAGSPTPNLAAFVEALKVGGRVDGHSGEGSVQVPDACWSHAGCSAGTLQLLQLLRMYYSLFTTIWLTACVAALGAFIIIFIHLFPQGLRQGQRVPIEFFTFGERHRRKSSILHVNWSW